MAAPIGEIIAGAVEGTFNTGLNLWNTILQQQKFDYDKAIQQKIFEREDTGVQRRMADLQAAGLNPQLAAGSAAGAGSVVSTQAPQMKGIDIGAMLDTALAVEKIKQEKQNTKNLRKQFQILDEEEMKIRADRIGKDYENQYQREYNDYLFAPEYVMDGYGNLYPNERPGVFRELMKYQLNNAKNSADLLQKQNDWFTTNQILGAVSGIIGDVAGLGGGFNNFSKGFNTILSPKFKR